MSGDRRLGAKLHPVGWGLDGFAILGGDGKIYIARLSATIPPGMDQNNDGISDSWAATHFGSLTIDKTGDADGDGVLDAFEYFFGTPPWQMSVNPVQVTTTRKMGKPRSI